MAIVINGHTHKVPGRVGVSFLDDHHLALATRDDWRPRGRAEHVIGIVVHTRMGLPVIVRPGAGPNRGWDLDVAARWTKDGRKASAHLAVDPDGSYGCFADLATVAAYHAEHVNGVTVGLEMYQDIDGGVYQETLEATADILDVLTRLLGIQRQFSLETAICHRFANTVPTNKYTYMPGANRGRDFSGIYGHRNVTRNRGPGDPGDPIFEVLRGRGYEGYRVDAGEDIAVWAKRQRELGVLEHEVDGVPEIVTRSLITHLRRGGPGLWVERPGDDTYHPPPAE